jgi:hypothetical protein
VVNAADLSLKHAGTKYFAKCIESQNVAVADHEDAQLTDPSQAVHRFLRFVERRYLLKGVETGHCSCTIVRTSDQRILIDQVKAVDGLDVVAYHFYGQKLMWIDKPHHS